MDYMSSRPSRPARPQLERGAGRLAGAIAALWLLPVAADAAVVAHVEPGGVRSSPQSSDSFAWSVTSPLQRRRPRQAQLAVGEPSEAALLAADDQAEAPVADATPAAPPKPERRRGPLAAALAPVAPWAAVSLAALGHAPAGPRASALLGSVGSRRGGASAADSVQVASSASEGANGTSSRTPVGDSVSSAFEAAELGSWALASKAEIIGRALLQIIAGSALELERGNLTRVMKVAQETVVEAERESSLVDAQTTGAAARSIGILLIFVFIAASWGMELFLTKRVGEKTVEDDKEAQISRQFLPALSFSRYLMSWFVVMSNMYRPGEGMHQILGAGHTWLTFARWGSIGIPWFFLVSGFCHTFSVLVGRKQEVPVDEFFHGMVRRVAPWYPLYIFSMTWCALRSWSIYAEDWAHYMANALLIQGFIWPNTEFPYVQGDWWLSYLMVYLLCWTPMHQVLGNSSNSVIWTLFTIAFLIAIPSAILEWIFMEDVAPFMMIQYFPSFVFGQALATWFFRNCMVEKTSTAEPVYQIRPVHELPAMVRFGVTLSVFVLGIMFFLFGPNDRLPLIRKPIAPFLLKGGLLPILGLAVASLACEVDPIAKLFARTPFRWFEKLALSNFILQVPIYNTVKDMTGWTGFTWTYVGCLLLSSILGHIVLERPWRRILQLREK